MRQLGLLALCLIAGLVIWAFAYTLANPSPHSPHRPSPSASGPAAPVKAHKATARPSAPPPARTQPPKPVTAKPAAVRYTVRLGDSLSSIAVMYRLAGYVPLYRANQAAIGGNPDLIHVGLRLRIP